VLHDLRIDLCVLCWEKRWSGRRADIASRAKSGVSGWSRCGIIGSVEIDSRAIGVHCLPAEVNGHWRLCDSEF